MKGLSINFNYNRNKRLDSSGKAPLQIQIHLNGQTRYLFVESIFPNQWDGKNKKIKVVGGKGKITNSEKLELENLKERVRTFESQAFSFYNERIRLAGVCSAKEIKDFLKGEKPVGDFMEFLRKEVFDNPNQKKNTKAKAIVFYNNLEKFREYRKTELITFKEINRSFVREFEKFLQQKRKLNGEFLSQNYVTQTLQDLKRFCTLADELIESQPFKNWKFKNIESIHTYLTYDELLSFEALEIPSGKSRAKITKEIALFSCWTGLRISDLIDRDIDTGEKESFGLKVKHIEKREDGLYLIKTPKKTRSKFVTVELPLHILFGGKPQRLIEKKIKHKSKEEYVFDSIRNDTVSRWVTKFMNELGIDKEIKFHSFRHTFAELMHNEFDLPLEDLRLLMGHKELKSTMIYAKTKHDRAIRAAGRIDWDKLK